MATKAQIAAATRAALADDNKPYKLSQVMNAGEYSYNTPSLMRRFLNSVATKLEANTPPVILNVGALDSAKCMNGTLADLQSYILLTINGNTKKAS